MQGDNNELTAMAQQWLVLKGTIPPPPPPPHHEGAAAAAVGGYHDGSSSSSGSAEMSDRWSRDWSLAALACLQRVMLGLGAYADEICNTCQVRLGQGVWGVGRAVMWPKGLIWVLLVVESSISKGCLHLSSRTHEFGLGHTS